MAVTDYQSLYGVCNEIAIEGVSAVKSIGGYDTFIEIHTQDDIDKNWNDIQEGNYDENNNLITKCTFGADSDESHIILVVADNIEIPEGYTLTPVNPKKSLVFLCDKFINNGIVSMTGKGPNILPHEYYLIGQSDGYDGNIIIPAYANNEVPSRSGINYEINYGLNGNNGVNRQCGSGGHGCKFRYYSTMIGERATMGASGSGSAFAGGAGSGGVGRTDISDNVDPIYPMHGGDGGHNGIAPYTENQGGVGNPPGTGYGIGESSNAANSNLWQNAGVGGRIIIFCTKFENNGTISANGVNCRGITNRCVGGASGGGAVDIFYNKLVTEGTIVANGGSGFSMWSSAAAMGGASGNGGNGSVTLTQYSASAFVLPGYANKETLTKFGEIIKEALHTKANKTDLEDVITNLEHVIDDSQQSLTTTYSSEKIVEILPKKFSELENDIGVVVRTITPKEMQSIWDDVEIDY